MPVSSPAAAKDNLLGICAAIGEDFSFNPIYLRIALAAGMLWSAPATLGIYLGAGVVVALSRLVVRRRKPAPRAAGAEPVAPSAPVARDERVLEDA